MSDPSSESDQQNVLIAHLPHVLSAISTAFDTYGVKSSLILVDTIGTIADSVREDLKNPGYTAMYLPKLMHKFNSLEDLDMRMFPMLECLSSVLSVIGLDAQQYVLNIYHRCLRIASGVLKTHIQHTEDQIKTNDFSGEDDLPSKDFAICSLDVISSLCEGLDHMFGTLVNDTSSASAGTGGTTKDALFELMFAAICDNLPEMRQSGFSLSGEICKHAFVALLDPALASRLLQFATINLDTDYPLVCNNAAWTIGELAMQSGGEFLQPFIPRLMNSLITALQTAHLEDNIKVNVAVTIGRLAMVDTLEVAELADEYFADWCR